MHALLGEKRVTEEINIVTQGDKTMDMKKGLKRRKRTAMRRVRVRLRKRRESRRSRVKEESAAVLTVKAFNWIARRREASIGLGSIFNEMKSLFANGRWEQYFEKTFAPRGITQRRALFCMRLARLDTEFKKIAGSLYLTSNGPQIRNGR
jgi:hypothetical protein